VIVALALLSTAQSAAGPAPAQTPAGSAGAPTLAHNPFDHDFWKHWGDGRAEISTYDLVYPRYGELRQGSAVAIFVTETFSSKARVKADPGRHTSSDEFPVMKLNLVQDFATGIYDYNLMTSVFVALAPWSGQPAGSPAKVSFSGQDWCGQVFHEVLPRGNTVRHVLHSYFDGEGDRDDTLDSPANGVLEDALFHWARGLATPFLEPGEGRDVRLLRSAEESRVKHVPLTWQDARLGRSRDVVEVTVPAGSFAVETLTATIDGASSWTFRVEKNPPRRIVQWERSDGKRADLVASERLEYWKMNENRFEEELARIGLSPRPARTP
jgi:hypothetical protein